MKKSLLCLLVFTVYAAFAVPVPELSDLPVPSEYSEDREYPRYIEFPDGEGNMRTVDLEAEPDMELLDEIERNPANNQYLLFTRRNPRNAQTLRINNANSITSSNFNARVPTVVIAHGWLSNQHTDINPTIRDAYLGKSDVNVIVLDWRRLALSDYATAARGVPAVGRGLGQFLAFLHSVTGAPYNSMHLVGFSLGAHLVGNAGREIGGRAARVTALDPAGPLWNYNSNRVNPRDGVYVEAIHTDGGYTIGGLGIGSNVANADFYPNGGISQPGCLTNLCNHNRAWELFAATVTYNHLVGRLCANNSQLSLNTCRGTQLRMGNDDLRKTGRNPRNSQTLVINNANSIRNSNFNAAHPTVVVAHGWLSNQNTNINPTIRDAYLNKAETNVIILDWRRLALSDYATAARGVPAVGRGLGQFLAFLNSVTGQAFTSMHLVGFSLGAHLVGNAGRELGGRAARVTALDPAGPLWNYNSNRVNPRDGVYVEAIHTDGGYTIGGLGIGSNVANADFYPNGGISQPGCLTNLCNHNRAWELFAATVTYNHLVGRLCTSQTQLTWNTCRGAQLRMGNDDLRKTGSGMYRLDTGRRYPY